MINFFLNGQFIGRYGSSSPSNSTIESSVVFTCCKGCVNLPLNPLLVKLWVLVTLALDRSVVAAEWAVSCFSSSLPLCVFEVCSGIAVVFCEESSWSKELDSRVDSSSRGAMITLSWPLGGLGLPSFQVMVAWRADPVEGWARQEKKRCLCLWLWMAIWAYRIEPRQKRRMSKARSWSLNPGEHALVLLSNFDGDSDYDKAIVET